MKVIILFAVFTLVVADNEYYQVSNDNIEINKETVSVPRLKTFLDCYNDAGPCFELADNFKQYFPEAVKQACRRCSPAQKHMFRQFLDVIKEVLPTEYSVFKQKYDPENKYFDALEKELSQY